MKSENKNRWMVWAIVILAAMNIATIVTVLRNRNLTKEENFVEDDSQLQPEAGAIRYSGRWYRDQLNFNREQMNRFAGINSAFREDVQFINLNLNLLRQKMLDEMASDGPDTIRLNILSDSIGTLHSDLKKITYKYYTDLKTICNEQQKEKLEHLFSGMFSIDGRMGPYGRGNQQGRRRGWQINNQ